MTENTYDIYISGNYNAISNNILDGSTTTDTQIGLYIGADNYNTVTGNTIRSKRTSGQSTSNTYAIYFQSGSYNLVHNNNLTGVTKAASPGAACNVTAHGSVSSRAVLGTGGSIGYNLE